MSRCIQFALILSTVAACERAGESSAPSIVLPAEESTSTSTSAKQHDPEPPAITIKVAPKPAPVAEPEPAYEEVRFMTRAGPKWVRKKPDPVRVRKLVEPAK